MSKKQQNIYLVWQEGEKIPTAFRFKTDIAEHLNIPYRTLERVLKGQNKVRPFTIIQTELK